MSGRVEEPEKDIDLIPEKEEIKGDQGVPKEKPAAKPEDKKVPEDSKNDKKPAEPTPAKDAPKVDPKSTVTEPAKDKTLTEKDKKIENDKTKTDTKVETKDKLTTKGEEKIETVRGDDEKLTKDDKDAKSRASSPGKTTRRDDETRYDDKRDYDREESDGVDLSDDAEDKKISDLKSTKRGIKHTEDRKDNAGDKTLAETKPQPRDVIANNDVKAEAQNIINRHNEEAKAVDVNKLYWMRATIFIIIGIIWFVTVIFLEIIWFVQEAWFYTDNVKIHSVLGVIFFISFVLTIFLQFLTYEIWFYAWRAPLIWWMIITLIIGICFIALGIIFIIITLLHSSSYYTNLWNDLSTSNKSYFDNKESDMKQTHRLNTILTSIFCIVIGVLYLIEFIVMVIYKSYATPNLPLKLRMPPSTSHGYDDLEEQPFIEVRRKDKKKKTKKSKAKKQQVEKRTALDIKPIGLADNFNNDPNALFGPGVLQDAATVNLNDFQRPVTGEARRDDPINPLEGEGYRRGFSGTQNYDRRPLTGDPRFDRSMPLGRDDSRYGSPDDRRYDRPSSFGRSPDRRDYDRDVRTPDRRGYDDRDYDRRTPDRTDFDRDGRTPERRDYDRSPDRRDYDRRPDDRYPDDQRYGRTPDDRGYDRGYDRRDDRSYDRGYDRGYDRNYDRSYDRRDDRGYDDRYSRSLDKRDDRYGRDDDRYNRSPDNRSYSRPDDRSAYDRDYESRSAYDKDYDSRSRGGYNRESRVDDRSYYDDRSRGPSYSRDDRSAYDRDNDRSEYR